MFVIVNVDDLGLNPAVTRAVQELASMGTVTSSTLMVNAPYASRALTELRDAGVGIGVHLNILRGSPVSDPAKIPTLVDKQTGLFPGSYRKLFSNLRSGRLDPRQAKAEWMAQIERAREMGLEPDHVDSEKHVHGLPGLNQAAAEAAAEAGVPWMRRPMERGWKNPWRKPGRRTWFLRVWRPFHVRVRGIAQPDSCWGIADQGVDLLPERFEAWANRFKPRLVEIVCHPGVSSPDDPGLPEEFGPMRVEAQWEAEMRSLSNQAWLETFDRLGAKPVSYGELDPAQVLS